MIRPVWLHSLNLADIVSCHIIHPPVWLVPRIRQSVGLYSKNWNICIQIFLKPTINEHTPICMDTKKWQARSLHADGDQRSHKDRLARILEQLSQSGDGRRLEQDRDGQAALKLFFNHEHQVYGSQRVTADFKKTVMDANWILF